MYSHILFTPQSYHVGATESVSFTSYSPEQFEVTATVSYDQCSCSNRRRRCSNNGDILSTARGSTRLGESGNRCKKFCWQPVGTWRGSHLQCSLATGLDTRHIHIWNIYVPSVKRGVSCWLISTLLSLSNQLEPIQHTLFSLSCNAHLGRPAILDVQVCIIICIALCAANANTKKLVFSVLAENTG